MFSNLRYVAVSVFGVLVLLTLIAGMYFKSTFVENVLRLSVEQEAQVLADSYTKSIWNRYYPVIGYITDRDPAEWKIFPQYQAFVDDSKELFNASNLIKVSVHSPVKGLVFASNDAALTEKAGFFSFQNVTRDKNALKAATEGKNVSYTISSVEITSNGKAVNKSVLKSFIPLKVTEVRQGTEDLASKAKAVLEINFDVSETVKRIDTIQFMLIFLVITALAVLTTAVFVSSQKAESVIEKQQEVSLEMASAKASAESESKAKSQFLANVSHELRTPLNAIIGFSEIISSEAMGPINNDQYKEFIKDIHTSGVHLLSLINDILDFSKAEENKLSVDFEQVDVTKLAKMCVRMVLPRAEQAKVKLTENIPAEHVIAFADSKRLKQVVLNLLSNSVKFTPENGEVGLKLWKNADTNSVNIEIHDTGVGMAAQDLAKALAPFGQVDNKLSRRYEGTGLGLPLTKKLVELMKGKFDIRSEVGLGTTVTISLPLLSAAEGEAVAENETKAGAGGLKPTSLVQK